MSALDELRQSFVDEGATDAAGAVANSREQLDNNSRTSSPPVFDNLIAALKAS